MIMIHATPRMACDLLISASVRVCVALICCKRSICVLRISAPSLDANHRRTFTFISYSYRSWGGTFHAQYHLWSSSGQIDGEIGSPYPTFQRRLTSPSFNRTRAIAHPRPRQEWRRSGGEECGDVVVLSGEFQVQIVDRRRATQFGKTGRSRRGEHRRSLCQRCWSSRRPPLSRVHYAEKAGRGRKGRRNRTPTATRG